MSKQKFCMDCGSSLILKEIDSYQKLICSSNCGYIHWNNPTPVIAILIKYKDKYLIAHNRQWPKGLYSTISGFLEEKETIYECAIRETKEELGLNIIKNKIIDAFTYKEMNQLIIAMFAECEGEISLSDEIDEFRLLTLDELKLLDVGPMKLLEYIISECVNQGLFSMDVSTL
ncbi:NUDIX domain-containing protein [Acinetobacter halotolerans]|uniref:NUDIX domain-containing protein n=1 Tax=Acinetobacter halotolerans TaxID=1752076 RepID=A0A4Q6XAD5_9GAMM|nr:NUDIX domain-containing protein [Acinetobacter halotolerans]RZF51640.1 NUDIX domain-containing protein [Acinetobacter halotolerans]